MTIHSFGLPYMSTNVLKLQEVKTMHLKVVKSQKPAADGGSENLLISQIYY